MASKLLCNPASDRQDVETVDGLGYLTGHRKEQDGTFFPEEKKERLRYNSGVVILKERIERFYYPQTTREASSEDIQAYKHSSEVQS